MTQPAPPAPAPPSPRLVTVNAVHWQNLLDFTHLFRGFRLAINPAKLGIALFAILLIYIAGRSFDVFWGPQVFAEEMRDLGTVAPARGAAYRATHETARSAELQRLLRDASALDATLTSDRINDLKDSPRSAYPALKNAYEKRFADDIRNASLFNPTPEALQAAHAAAATRLFDSVQQARRAAGQGIFDSFLHYEIDQFNALVDNTLGIVRITPTRQSASGNDEAAASLAVAPTDHGHLWRSDTIVGCIANMAITAPAWLFFGTGPMQSRPSGAERDTWLGWLKMLATRALYLFTLTLLALFFLLIIAFAGGSIARLSALELSGIERPPLKDVFAFTQRRLWTFIKAPIMPLLILLVVGLAMAGGGLLGAIPFIGEIILGVVFILFLAIGFVLMLLMLGIIGGFNLLYPTVAVEGADSFDAMSRSFAYVYARPWRLLTYTLTSFLYGALTLIFVSFAVYLILAITHTFTGWGTSFFGMKYGAYSGLPKLDTLWPAPQFGHLVTPINWYAMSTPEYLGALFLHFWVFLLISAIGAYAISYYFSSHTIMYLLLRRSVDGQGLREVYIEEPTPVPPAPAPSPTPVPPAPAPAVEAQPPSPAPSEPPAAPVS